MSKKSGVKVDVKRDSTKGRLWSRLGVVPLLQTEGQILGAENKELQSRIDSLNEANKALMDSLNLKQEEVDSLELIQQDTIHIDIKVTPTK